MKRVLAAIVLACVVVCPAYADERASGFCTQGGQRVTINNQTSTTSWQQSYPSCTVTVYETGSTTLATIYSDNSQTPKSNPFVASSNGYWFFYAANGRYDVRFSGGGIAAPFTLSDFQLLDMGSGDFDIITAISGLGSNGLIARTSASTAAARTITAGANIGVTNGDGVSGNPTVALSATVTGITLSGASNTLTVLAGSQLSGQVPLANGGTAANLVDPGGDRVLFWDESANAVTFLNAASCISGTTWTCTATGTITGTGTANTLAKFSASTVIADSGITDDATTIKLARNTRITTGALSINGDFTAQAQLHEKATANMLVMEETDAAADTKVFRWQMAAGVLSLVTLTDAYAAGQTVYTISRTGTTFTAMNLGNTATTLSGYTLTSTMGSTGLENTAAAQELAFYRSTAGANGNSLGTITLQGKDSGGTRTTFATLTGKSATATDSSEAGQLDVVLINAGATVTNSFTTTLNTFPVAGTALGTTPATAGTLRVPHGASLQARNNADAANINLITWGVTATDLLIINDAASPQGIRIYGTELAADPSAPATNQFVIYAKDTGAAKTTLCARFATGATQCFATEP